VFYKTYQIEYSYTVTQLQLNTGLRFEIS